MSPSGRSARIPRLDPLDRHILTLIDADPSIAPAALAGEVGLAPRSVSRRVRRMTEGGVLAIRGRTLPGFGGRSVRMLRIGGSPDTLRNLGELLSTEAHTTWVRLSRDASELVFGTVGTRAHQDERWMNLTVRHPGVTSVRAYDLLTVWSRSLPLSAPDPSREIDDADTRLLRLLAHDGWMSNAEAGRILGLDPSSISRRRRRLEAEGILYLEAEILPEVLSATVDAMLWITVAPGQIVSTALHLQGLAPVRFTAATTGQTALLVNVLLPDVRSVLSFVDEHLAQGRAVQAETVLMGSVLKRSAPHLLSP